MNTNWKLGTCSEGGQKGYLERMPAPKALMSSPSRKTPNSIVYLQTQKLVRSRGDSKEQD